VSKIETGRRKIVGKNSNNKRKPRLSASARRAIEARKITAKVKESTAETLKAVRAGRYA